MTTLRMYGVYLTPFSMIYGPQNETLTL